MQELDKKKISVIGIIALLACLPAAYFGFNWASELLNSWLHYNLTHSGVDLFKSTSLLSSRTPLLILKIYWVFVV